MLLRGGLQRVAGRCIRRSLNTHEYLSHDVLRKFDVATANGHVAHSTEEARDAAKKLGVHDYVVKAQVLAGGRGKGTFSNGFQGGVHTATTVEEVADLASSMLGERLITKQTGEEGRPVDSVHF